MHQLQTRIVCAVQVADCAFNILFAGEEVQLNYTEIHKYNCEHLVETLVAISCRIPASCESSGEENLHS